MPILKAAFPRIYKVLYNTTHFLDTAFERMAAHFVAYIVLHHPRTPAHAGLKQFALRAATKLRWVVSKPTHMLWLIYLERIVDVTNDTV